MNHDRAPRQMATAQTLSMDNRRSSNIAIVTRSSGGEGSAPQCAFVIYLTVTPAFSNVGTFV
jgi:hypothetical protein